MEIIKHPADTENTIQYDIEGNMISFNDGELAFNLARREKDYPVHFDICADDMGALISGVLTGMRYMAQIDIPARRYEEVQITNPSYDPEDSNSSETITMAQPVPFDIDNCTLTLWELEA